MKKIIIILLIVLMLLATYAVIGIEDKYVPIECVDINELSTLPYEDSYSFQEVLTDMQHNKLLSKEKINQFNDNNNKISTPISQEDIRYAIFYMDTYTFTKDNLIGSNSYLLQPRIYLGFIYDDITSYPTKIVSLDLPYIYTKTGNKCKFIGDIFYKLEAGNRFFMGINGDVYKKVKEIKEGTSIVYNTNSNYYLRNVAFDVKYYSAEMQP